MSHDLLCGGCHKCLFYFCTGLAWSRMAKQGGLCITVVCYVDAYKPLYTVSAVKTVQNPPFSGHVHSSGAPEKEWTGTLKIHLIQEHERP